jgi:hypothetical protein
VIDVGNLDVDLGATLCIFTDKFIRAY